jgi:uncharacterized protein YjiS (DUF1127 family)
MIRTDVGAGFRSRPSISAGSASPVGIGQHRYRVASRASKRPWLEHALDLLAAWSERVRQRRELLRFDDHMLRDIGLSRADALAEADKPFWRA